MFVPIYMKNKRKWHETVPAVLIASKVELRGKNQKEKKLHIEKSDIPPRKNNEQKYL